MEHPVKFQYGSFEAYKELNNKDPDTLYFLDNSHVYKGDELLTIIHSVTQFKDPDELDSTMKCNYYISLVTGEIKYVNEELEYVDISKLMIRGVVLQSSFIQEFIDKIQSQLIQMPTLSVDEHVLVWESSNIDKVNVLTNKIKE